MIIRPDYVLWGQDDTDRPSYKTSGSSRYEQYTADQIDRDLHRQLRRLDEIHLHPASGTGKTALIERISSEVEQMQNELIRRALSRHHYP